MKASAKVIVSMGVFTIVNCKLYSAIKKSERVSFNNLHEKCKSKTQEKVFCPTCKKDIIDKKTEIAKGYEISQGKWIVLTQEEIDSCKKDASDVVRIFQFIDADELCEIYYSDSSFLVTEKEGLQAYSLLYQALETSGKIALAKMISRGKDNFLAIKPYVDEGRQVLVCYDLHFPTQINSTKEIAEPLDSSQFDAETVELVMGVIKKMTKPFNPSVIQDDYTTALRNIIRTKAAGGTVDIGATQVERKVLSLKDALKASLEEAA